MAKSWWQRKTRQQKSDGRSNAIIAALTFAAISSLQMDEEEEEKGEQKSEGMRKRKTNGAEKQIEWKIVFFAFPADDSSVRPSVFTSVRFTSIHSSLRFFLRHRSVRLRPSLCHSFPFKSFHRFIK
ncbi:hypothetical protein niasHT_000262 [Heterodera trifolii]|uniref:Uncharacterized protein n=1 Tax=Heterodera trifolii TaxID=157864 RepID=A0ABD2LUE9_9BILA